MNPSERLRSLRKRAVERGKSMSNRPDTPEEIAEQSAITEAMRPLQWQAAFAASEGDVIERKRAGLTWDQVWDAIYPCLSTYPSPDHSTNWNVSGYDEATDAVWALLPEDD